MNQVAAQLLAHHAVDETEIHNADLYAAEHAVDSVTALLAVARCPEELVHAASAQVLGYLPGPAGELPAPQTAVRRLFPAQSAHAARLFPVRMEADRILVYCARVLSVAELAELEELAALPLTLRAVLALRIDEGLARHYGGELAVGAARVLAQRGADPSASFARSLAPAAAPAAGLVALPPAAVAPSTTHSVEDEALSEDIPIDEQAASEPSGAQAPLAAADTSASYTDLAKVAGLAMLAATDGPGVLIACFDFLRAAAPCAALLVPEAGDIRLVRCAGAPQAAVGARIPLGGASLFEAASAQAAAHTGPLRGTGPDRVFLLALGEPTVAEAMVVAIAVGGRVLAFLYASAGASAATPPWLPLAATQLAQFASERLLVLARAQRARVSQAPPANPVAGNPVTGKASEPRAPAPAVASGAVVVASGTSVDSAGTGNAGIGGAPATGRFGVAVRRASQDGPLQHRPSAPALHFDLERELANAKARAELAAAGPGAGAVANAPAALLTSSSSKLEAPPNKRAPSIPPAAASVPAANRVQHASTVERGRAADPVRAGELGRTMVGMPATVRAETADAFLPAADASDAAEVWTPGAAPSLRPPSADVWRPDADGIDAGALRAPAVPGRGFGATQPMTSPRPNTDLRAPAPVNSGPMATRGMKPAARPAEAARADAGRADAEWRPGGDVPAAAASAPELWVPGGATDVDMRAPAFAPKAVEPVAVVAALPLTASAVAHAPAVSRARPASASDAEPSIVIADAEEYGSVVERALVGDAAARAELVRAGVAAMPALMARFPGKFVLQLPDSGPLPAACELSAPVALALAMGRHAVAYLETATEDPQLATRIAATMALAALGTASPRIVSPGSASPSAVALAAVALGREPIDACLKLAQDDDLPARNVGIELLRNYSVGNARVVLESLARVATDVQHPPPRRILVIDAMGQMLQPIAVPLLVPMLADAFAQVALAALRALALLTGQDFGRDSRKWVSWWSGNVGRHRAEWLIDGLLTDDAALLERNVIQLERLINVRLPDEFLATRAGRDQLFGELRNWWKREGRDKLLGESA